MAHFAELNSSNKVIRVLVVPESQEQRGADFLSKDLKLGGQWLKCSYTGSMRKRFPGNGDFYDSDLDMFVSAQPYPSWTLDSEGQWQPPISLPDDVHEYEWDEPSLSWIVL